MTKKKLKNDLQAAAKVASAIDQNDYGLINFDAPVIQIPGLKPSTVEEAAAEVGMLAYPATWGDQTYVVDFYPQAKTELRSDVVNRFAAEMTSRGYKASTLLSLGKLYCILNDENGEEIMRVRFETGSMLPMEIINILRLKSKSRDWISEISDKVKRAYENNPLFREYLKKIGYKEDERLGANVVYVLISEYRDFLQIVETHIKNNNPYFSPVAIRYAAFVLDSYNNYLANV